MSELREDALIGSDTLCIDLTSCCNDLLVFLKDYCLPREVLLKACAALSWKLLLLHLDPINALVSDTDMRHWMFQWSTFHLNNINHWWFIRVSEFTGSSVELGQQTQKGCGCSGHFPALIWYFMAQVASLLWRENVSLFILFVFFSNFCSLS